MTLFIGSQRADWCYCKVDLEGMYCMWTRSGLVRSRSHSPSFSSSSLSLVAAYDVSFLLFPLYSSCFVYRFTILFPLYMHVGGCIFSSLDSLQVPKSSSLEWALFFCVHADCCPSRENNRLCATVCTVLKCIVGVLETCVLCPYLFRSICFYIHLTFINLYCSSVIFGP